VGRFWTPERQVRSAWVSVLICLVGWPLTTLPFSPWRVEEPLFILCLSWWAVLDTALGRISSSEANKKVSTEE
jgi:hypothetical protein